MAADKKARFLIDSGTTVKALLEKEVGLPVKLRLKSGAEIGGTVAMVGTSVVQIAEVTGMEFYDVVINIEDVSAVYVKVRSR